MFTRRGEAARTAAVRPLPEPQLSDLQLLNAIQEARAAASPVSLALPQHQQAYAQSTAIGTVPATANGGPPPVPVAASDTVDSTSERHSVIGEDLSIEGQSITIRCRGALEINGHIQAELHSQKLVVGRSGQIEGMVAAESVDVWGRVSGTIMGARVVLHPSAEVEGDIHAKVLSVADGATFEGRSRKVTDAATIAPRLDPASAPMGSPDGILVPTPREVQLGAA